MGDVRSILERGVRGVAAPPDPFGRMLRRRDRKRRRQRIAAGIVGVAVALAVAVGLGQIGSFRAERDRTGGKPTTTLEGRVLFSRRTGAGDARYLGLYSVPADGSGSASAFFTEGYVDAGRVSPDGTSVAMAVTYNGHPDTAIVDAGGNGYRVLDPSQGPLALVCDTWAPDGELLACTGILDPRRAGMYLIRPDGTGLRRVTDVPADLQATHTDGPCGFSPDGTQLAFTRMNVNPPDGHGDLYVVNVDRAGEHLVSDIGIDFGCDWSPADDTIVAGGDGELYLISLDGNVTVLPKPGGIVNVFAPSFSPDGSSIVFSGTTEPGGRFDIYRMDVDGTDLVQLTNTPNITEEYPVWA